MAPAMAQIHVNQEYPVVDIRSAMAGHAIPSAWIDKGATVQALLQHCRHVLKHQARVPDDLATMTNLTWRTDDGEYVGKLQADQIRVVVDMNRSHFEYVTLHQRLPDGQELPMLCVSATIKGLHTHPTYDQNGRPSRTSGNSGTHDRDYHRGRRHHTLDSGGFPTAIVPEVLPKLEDIVRSSETRFGLHTFCCQRIVKLVCGHGC